MTNSTAVLSGSHSRAEQVPHVGAGDLVERRERLVHEQVRRADRERPREGDALLHAARQLVRVGGAELVEADSREQRLDVGQRRAGCRRG